MRRLLILLFIAMALAPAQAMPQISDFAATPQSAYLGEDVVLSFTCNSTNSPIQHTNISITGPELIVPDIAVPGNLFYSITLGSDYIDRIGDFTATAYCRDAEAETSATAAFSVASVVGGIVEVSPDAIYTGDTVEIIFDMKKDGVPLTSSVEFALFIDGVQKDARSIVYDTRKGWVLKMDAPDSPGSHQLKIIARYDRINVTSEQPITVRNPLEFTVEGFDRSSVVANDNVTVTLRAYNRGQAIAIDNNLRIYLEGQELDKNITISGGLIYAKITMPNVAPNAYNVRAVLTYGGSEYTAMRQIQYIIPVSGRFVDGGRAISVQIRFLQGGTERLKFITDSAGSYSGQLVPGKYDIEFTFPDATLRLNGASISYYNNSIGYSYMTDVKVPGIAGNSVYYFSSFTSFSRATVEIPLKDMEDDIKVFRCSLFVDRVCKTSWTETSAYVDKAQHIVRLDVDSLATFALGYRESVDVNFNTEKKTYSVKEPIGIRGSTQDSAKNIIPNAKLDVRLGNDVIGNLNSDSNGIFYIELQAPDVEGTYNLTVYAEKSPYLRGEKSLVFDVQKIRALSVLFSDTVRVGAGSNLTKELTIVNTGQDDLNDVQLSMDGIPEEYYRMEKKTFNLPVGEQEKITIIFTVPVDAGPTTLEGNIKLSSLDINKEKSFGFTIAEPSKDVPAAGNSPATGFAFDFSLPSVDISYIYLIVFAAAAFSFAIVMKKVRGRTPRMSMRARPAATDNMNTLSDIKNHIRSAQRTKKGEENG
jgi:hypothetical protein